MALVLAVEGEPGLLRVIEAEFLSEGFEVQVATHGTKALELNDTTAPDLVVVDVSLPDMSGLEVLREIRQRSFRPVLLITAPSVESKITGLNLGADDCLAKPFNPAELVARAKAILRGVRQHRTSKALHISDIEIDLETRLVSKAGRPIAFSRTEWQLLSYLAERQGEVVPFQEILAEVWGPDYIEQTQFLRVWISRLRAKLETDPNWPKVITTSHGKGYRLEPDSGKPSLEASGRQMTRAS